MDQIGAPVAADAISKVLVAPLIQQIDDVIHLVQNRGFLQANKLYGMKLLLQDICNGFQNQQRTAPESIRDCLESTRDAVAEVKSLIDRSQLQQRCLDCIFCKPRVSRQIREWHSRFDQLLQELRTLFSIFAHAEQIGSSSAQPPAKETLQPLPEWGIVGMEIKSAEILLQRLINAETPQFPIIGVFGMAGVGKTTLLKLVYNFYKVSDDFDVVIWVTVSQDYKIRDLQGCIAEAISLDLSRSSDIDSRKMKLFASLKKTKFILILDDMWDALDMQELGVAFGTYKPGSKVVFSTRSRELASTEAWQCIKVEPLSRDEGRALFERVAFKGGDVPEELKECAREIGDECEGLPLAITVVAAAMSGNTSTDEWNTTLSLMKQADPALPETHPRVDKELYQKLRWSYDDLRKTPNLQRCFLYCAMFPGDMRINVDILVRMWIAEGYIKSDMALGHMYVKRLIDRGLIQNVNFEKEGMYNVNIPNVWKTKYITVHNIIRDMIIHIGEEEKYLCRAGLQLKDFPHSQTQADCKRISVLCNQIDYLPKDFQCPKLVSLILSENPLTHVPFSFMVNLASLRVLDLSDTHIQFVPTSLGQLRLLEFLTLKNTLIRDLPDAICNLSALQFLDLSFCRNLQSLPETIGNLRQLQYLNLMGLPCLVIPFQISELTSLKRLELQAAYGENAGALTGLTNLMELAVTIISETEEHGIAISLGTWSEMRHLSLRYQSTGAIKDLPQQMQKMNKLQSFQLLNYKGVNTLKASLPNWICDFAELERLELIGCDQLTDLPPLERLPKLKFLKFKDCSRVKYLGIGSSSTPDGFPMLKRLDLIEMFYLEGMVSLSSNVLIKGTLPILRVLKIKMCPKLKTLPMGLESLPNLIALIGEEWWWNRMIWEDRNMKTYLHQLFRGIGI